MKKLLYILSIALMGAVACDKQFGPDLPVVNVPEEGSAITLHFSIPTEVMTKGGMTDQPSIVPGVNTLHVFVFNANSGALLQVSEAEFEEDGKIEENTIWNPTTEEQIRNIDFKATVNMGSAPRYLHFVVDAPTYETDGSDDHETGIGYENGDKLYIGDSESAFASKVYTTGGKSAFWQRIYLANGLTAYTYPGGKPKYGAEGTDWTYTPDGDDDPSNDTYWDLSHATTVNVGDYVDGVGHKITDGVGYIMSDDVAALLRYVPVVRNFAKIEVSQASGSNFVPKKAALVNVPKSGYVAPFSSASGFVRPYLFQGGLRELPNQGAPYVAATGFTAPVPEDEIVTDCPKESDVVDAETIEVIQMVNGEPATVEKSVIRLFMYERGVPTSNPTQLLVFGSLNGGDDSWFKIDITDANGKYVPFYRDMNFEMEIGTLTGVSGYEEMEDAYAGPSIGNPSSSPETKNLTQVIDGKGVGIWVDFIDYASFEQAVTDPETGETSYPTVRLRYKFWDASGTKSADADLIIDHKTGTGAISVNSLTGSPYSGTDTQDGEGGWYYVNVPLQEIGSSILRSTLTVSGTGINSDGKEVTLYREVSFAVMTVQNFTLEIDTSPDDPKNVTLTVKLPENVKLGISMFPIVLRIEAFNGSLNPASGSDMTVGYGESTFATLDDSNPLYRTSKSYWFEKVIGFEEYDRGTISFPLNFVTIFESGNSTTIAVSDSAGHFNTATIALSD